MKWMKWLWIQFSHHICRLAGILISVRAMITCMLVPCKLFEDKPCFILDIGEKPKLSRGELKIYIGCIDRYVFVS